MSHTMNGKPIWCPPARTRDQAIPVIDEPQPTVTLKEAATLVRAAIKRGLIKPPNPGSTTISIGPRSVATTCTKCETEFGRDFGSTQPLCKICRLAKKTCTVCGGKFQPLQKKQKCCGVKCRSEISRKAAQYRMSPKIFVNCAWCKTPFERRPQDVRKANCSKECGFKSMAAKIRKPKTI